MPAGRDTIWSTRTAAATRPTSAQWQQSNCAARTASRMRRTHCLYWERVCEDVRQADPFVGVFRTASLCRFGLRRHEFCLSKVCSHSYVYLGGRLLFHITRSPTPHTQHPPGAPPQPPPNTETTATPTTHQQQACPQQAAIASQPSSQPHQ